MFKKVSITSLVLLLNLFISCKKGENDPKISLRTRKIRVEGEWIMKKGNASLTFNDPKATSFNQSFVMDGVKSTIYETQPANTGYYYYYVINYSFSIILKKTAPSLVSKILGEKY